MPVRMNPLPCSRQAVPRSQTASSSACGQAGCLSIPICVTTMPQRSPAGCSTATSRLLDDDLRQFGAGEVLGVGVPVGALDPQLAVGLHLARRLVGDGL